MKTSLVLRPIVASALSALVVSAVATACTDTGIDNPRSSGGSSTTGGAASGGAATGGAVSTGGVATGGAVSTGGVATGGAVSTGGVATGGAVSTGGVATGGASGDAGTAGNPSGGTGGVSSVMGPCDIYNAANNTCVAAYSVVRRLLSTYNGPLYQVRRGAPDPNTGSGGQTQDIGILPNGFADAAAHAAFCGNETCTFSALYDQSGQTNDLTVAKRGCYGCSEPQQTCSSCSNTACQDDHETDATHTITVGGNTVYTLHMDTQQGYRHNGTGWPTAAPPASGMPTDNHAPGQGVYMVAEGDGRRPDAALGCCWNFGNVSNNNCYGPAGQMSALMLGDAYWGQGAGSGPWFMGDFEAGVWAGGVNGDINSGGFDTNQNLPSMSMDFAFGILKIQPNNYALRVGDATTGALTTGYDGPAPNVFAGTGEWQMEGGIALGVGGDNSNSGSGTFLEGAITSSRPTDETDAAVHENVKAVGYGQ